MSPPLSVRSAAVAHVLVILLLMSALSAFAEERHSIPSHRHVLLIHSYHQGMKWVDDITAGFTKTLRSAQPDVEVHVEYMDTKRVVEPQHLQNLLIEYRFKFSRQKFDLVAVADDAAFQLALRHGDELFPGVPVVFCGVNEYSPSMLKGRPLFTGTLEDISPTETLRTALALHPQTKTVYVVNDVSSVGQALHREIVAALKLFEGRVRIEFLENYTSRDLAEKVRGLPGDSLILRSAFFIDREGRTFPNEEYSVRAIDRFAAVPVYGLWDFYLGLGIVGGKLISGAAQGETAALMANRILSGESPASIPVVTESPNRFMFDAAVLDRWGIRPSALPPGSVVINAAEPFYSIHKGLIWTGGAFTVAVSIFSVLLVLNIRKRKRIETQLREREKMLSLILDAVPQAVFWKDTDVVYVGCNQKFAVAAGLSTPSEVVGKTDYEFPWLTEEAERYRADDREVMKSGIAKYHIVESSRRSDGSVSWVDTTKIPLRGDDGSVIGLLGVFDDITERKHMEDALRESEERLRVIFETSQAGIVLVDAKGRISFANEKLAELLGRPLERLIGTTYMDYLHPDQLDIGNSLMRRLLDGEIDKVATERHYRRANGGDFWGHLSGKRLEGSDGKLTALVGVIADVTDHKQAREALEAEKERLAVTLRSIGDGVITVDTDERVTLLNKVAEELTGWNQEEAEGQLLSEVFKIVAERTGEPRESPVRQVLETGRIVELANHTVLVARGGTRRAIADSAAPIYDRESRIIGVVLVFRDTTEKHEIEEELFKARKLESLGVLAGGIAHDFNNLLSGILGNISLAQMYLPPDDRAAAVLERAEKASERARDLTRQLLTFSRGGAPVKKVASIAQLLTESASFAVRGSNVRCLFRIPEDLWPAEVDEGQMSQVISNLIINADQAMPSGGIITIGAENLSSEAEGGRRVRITVEDQGVGISPDNLSRIFDPYFTTKEHGSGLGLATVYSIIKNHDGEIRVSSRPGEGTQFTITLPAAEEHPARREGAPPVSSEGQGRVLVMDDEEVIRQVAAEILEVLGYEADICGDGGDALELYRIAREEGRPYRAVIMDLTIPGGMGGEEAAARLREMDADARIIVSSGYSNDPVMARYRDYGFSGAIVKPYKVEQLGESLRAVLG